MRLAGHTLGTPDLPLRGALELFAALGLGGAEIIWQDGYLSGLPEVADGAEVAEARAVAEDLGLEVVCLVPYVTALNDLDAARRMQAIDAMKRCVAAAAALRCPYVRVYAGRFLPDDRPQGAAMRERLVAALRELRTVAASAGVTLCVENHFNTMAVTAADTVRLVTDVTGDEPGDGLGILYDQANLAFTHSEPASAAIRQQAAWIRHVHVKDLVFIDPDRPFAAADVAKVEAAARTVASRPVGDGALDWREIVAALREVEYRGFLSLEYEYRWHPGDLPTPERGLARSAAFLRSILEAA